MYSVENNTTMKSIAIVTGASRGLGAAFASLLRQSDKVDEIWVIARHCPETPPSDHRPGPRIVPLCCDLTTEAGRQTVEKRLTEEPLHVDCLINNAGTAKFGMGEALTPTEVSDMLALNCIALTSLCVACIPHMERGAHIINIASIAAFLPVPEMSVYAATKAYVLRYSLALRRELAPRGISVTTVCPGWMDTDFIPLASAGKTHTDALCRYHYARTCGSQSVERRTAWKNIVGLRRVSPARALGVTPASPQLADDLLAMATAARVNLRAVSWQTASRPVNPVSRPVNPISRPILFPAPTHVADTQKGRTQTDAAFSIIL